MSTIFGIEQQPLTLLFSNSNDMLWYVNIAIRNDIKLRLFTPTKMREVVQALYQYLNLTPPPTLQLEEMVVELMSRGIMLVGNQELQANQYYILTDTDPEKASDALLWLTDHGDMYMEYHIHASDGVITYLKNEKELEMRGKIVFSHSPSNLLALLLINAVSLEQAGHSEASGGLLYFPGEPSNY